MKDFRNLPLEKTVILENGDAQLRYCRTRFFKVSTLRGVFEGADDEVRYIAATLKLKQAGWADARTDGGRTDAELKASEL